MSFSDSYKHTIDSKKRLFIPAKFRQKLGDTFYLYYDQNLPCIAVYGEEEWEKKSKIVEESGDADWQRFFFSNVVSAEPDKQGRITLKTSFCEDAGLKKDVVVAGVGTRIEIWDAEKYEKAMTQIRASYKRFPNIIN